MSSIRSTQHVEDGFNFDPGVTMAPALHQSRQTYSNFWKDYYSRPHITWEKNINNRIAQLMQLPDNWDGYNSPPLYEMMLGHLR